MSTWPTPHYYTTLKAVFKVVLCDPFCWHKDICLHSGTSLLCTPKSIPGVSSTLWSRYGIGIYWRWGKSFVVQA